MLWMRKSEDLLNMFAATVRSIPQAAANTEKRPWQ